MKRHRCIHCGVKSKSLFCSKCGHLSLSLKIYRKFDVQSEWEKLFHQSNLEQFLIEWLMQYPHIGLSYQYNEALRAAQNYRELGQLDIAKEKFLEKPDELYNLYGLAMVYFFEGDSEKSIETLKEIYRRDPSLIYILFEIGVLYHLDAKHEEAIDKYLTVISREAEIYCFFFPAHIYLVKALTKLKRRKEAIHYLEEIIANQTLYQKKHLRDLYIWLAFLYSGVHNIPQTVSYCKLALERDPDFSLAFFLIASSYLISNEIQSLLDFCEEQIPNNLNSYILWSYYGNALLRNKNYQNAKEIYIELLNQFNRPTLLKDLSLSLKTRKSTLLNNIAVCDLKMGEFDKAIEKLKDAVQLDKKNALFWSNYGLVYAKIGNYNQALYYINKALSINSEFAFSWYHLAKTYYKIGDFSKALEAVEKSLEYNPPANKPIDKYLNERSIALKKKILEIKD